MIKKENIAVLTRKESVKPQKMQIINMEVSIVILGGD